MKSTRDKGIIYKFNSTNGIEVFVDADFTETQTNSNSHEYTSSLSRTEYMIKVANCPVLWISKIQTKVALLTTEAEYIALL